MSIFIFSWSCLCEAKKVTKEVLIIAKGSPYPCPLAFPRLRAKAGRIQLFSPEMKSAEVQTEQNAQPPLFFETQKSKQGR